MSTTQEDIRGEEPTGGQYKESNEAFTVDVKAAIYGGGNVISLDDSNAGYGVPFNEAGVTADERILGISLDGTKKQLLNTYKTTGKIEVVRHGFVDVCLANDNQDIVLGDWLRAETDSITYDLVTSAKIGAVDLLAATALTTTGGATTHQEMANLCLELSEIVGMAMEAIANTTGGYIKCFLTLMPFYRPATA